jgi:AAA domain-containing protein
MGGCLRCAFRSEPGALNDARCEVCGRTYARLPLFVLNGATGVGKSTIGSLAAELLPECIHLDSDLLWSMDYSGDDAAVADYFARWLRLVAEISQSGHPVVLRGANNPDRWAGSPLGSYFSGIHYLALVASPEAHEARLRAREFPEDVENDPNFRDYLAHNLWLRANAIDQLDTTVLEPVDAAACVAAWVRARLPP